MQQCSSTGTIIRTKKINYQIYGAEQKTIIKLGSVENTYSSKGSKDKKFVSLNYDSENKFWEKITISRKGLYFEKRGSIKFSKAVIWKTNKSTKYIIEWKINERRKGNRK